VGAQALWQGQRGAGRLALAGGMCVYDLCVILRSFFTRAITHASICSLACSLAFVYPCAARPPICATLSTPTARACTHTLTHTLTRSLAHSLAHTHTHTLAYSPSCTGRETAKAGELSPRSIRSAHVVLAVRAPWSVCALPATTNTTTATGVAQAVTLLSLMPF
jgi:hypothetical protein